MIIIISSSSISIIIVITSKPGFSEITQKNKLYKWVSFG